MGKKGRAICGTSMANYKILRRKQFLAIYTKKEDDLSRFSDNIRINDVVLVNQHYVVKVVVMLYH